MIRLATSCAAVQSGSSISETHSLEFLRLCRINHFVRISKSCLSLTQVHVSILKERQRYITSSVVTLSLSWLNSFVMGRRLILCRQILHRAADNVPGNWDTKAALLVPPRQARLNPITADYRTARGFKRTNNVFRVSRIDKSSSWATLEMFRNSSTLFADQLAPAGLPKATIVTQCSRVRLKLVYRNISLKKNRLVFFCMLQFIRHSIYQFI